MTLTTPCYFLQLPPELRTSIYEYAFPIHQYCFTISHSLWRDKCCDVPVSFSHLRTCRQIHSEAKAVYLDRTTFRFGCCARPGIVHGCMIGKTREFTMLKYMRRVVVNLHTSAGYYSSGDMAASAAMRLMRASDCFESTRHLTLRIASKSDSIETTRGRLLVLTAVRSPGAITLVTQHRVSRAKCDVRVYKPLAGFGELLALLENMDENPREYGLVPHYKEHGGDADSDTSSSSSENDGMPVSFLGCLNNSSCLCNRCCDPDHTHAADEESYSDDMSYNQTLQYESEEEESQSGAFYDSGVNPHGLGGYWHDREG